MEMNCKLEASTGEQIQSLGKSMVTFSTGIVFSMPTL